MLCQIGDAAYTASKHAAVGFAESLAITHGDDGIQVCLVCPQAVATRLIGIDEDTEIEDGAGGFGGNDVDGILSTEYVADCILAGIQEEPIPGAPASPGQDLCSAQSRRPRPLDRGNAAVPAQT